MQIKIIGAGLAGCEAALWLADHGVQVDLYEQKPVKFSPAHKSAGFAELICSNSLKAERPDSADAAVVEQRTELHDRAFFQIDAAFRPFGKKCAQHAGQQIGAAMRRDAH